MYLQVFYEFIVNGKTIVKTQNTKPTVYKNVKVWASQGKYYPVTNARIKNFEYEPYDISNGKFLNYPNANFFNTLVFCLDFTFVWQVILSCSHFPYPCIATQAQSQS